MFTIHNLENEEKVRQYLKIDVELPSCIEYRQCEEACLKILRSKL